jgi:glucose/arabinose dehydrogenase
LIIAGAFALLGPASAPPPAPSSAAASIVPSGFEEVTVFSGLTNPMVVRFAADGRVFVAEKSGLIKVFDSITDTTPTTFADLRTNVHNYWDRGLLGMALHPSFPATPYVYVLYTYDHQLGSGSAPPRWGDVCPTPPGPTSDGCVVSGRLSRLQASGNVMTGPEQVLIEDWCQQYPSHSLGTVDFGPDGALYASAGDGASFTFADYGQDGSPLNPCGDPPGAPGSTLTPPTAEGGALRAQDVRTSSDPTGLDGTIIRVDPTTGAALPTNPLAGSSDPNTRRIIAYGLRNPFRFAFRPGTSEMWIGDVGWGDWEEINRILDPADSTVENFGWPCYEGAGVQVGYSAANLDLCDLPPSAVTAPYHAYHHSVKVVPNESCPTGSSSVSGISFEFAPTISSYPAAYQGALFFADYSRDCIWVMKKNGNPVPTPDNIETFVAAADNPVNLEFGPDGNLYYADFDGGTIRRVQPASPPPTSSAYLSDLNWTSMTNGWGSVEKDLSNGEQATGDGLTLNLNGTIYAKGLGAHAPSDVRYSVAGCTRFKASVGIDDEVGSNGSVTFEVYAGASKVYDSGLMTGTTATKLVDVSIAGASELRLVVTNGGDTNANDHADWALARVECGQDTTAPTISARTPAPGATSVSLDVSPTATFSEAMDAATLTTATFTLLKQGTATPVSASVSYDLATRTATLDPSANLEASATYTATVKGGSAGVKDLAGNPLAADSSWTFQTASQAPSATYLSDLTWTSMTNGWGPVEKDESNGETAAGDGNPLRLNGTTYPKGLGAHALSDVRYALASTCSRFKASVGVDDEVGSNGSVTFEVYAGASKVYDSGLMTGSTATKLVDVSIAGASELRLVVTNGGNNAAYDHADWALARIEC